MKRFALGLIALPLLYSVASAQQPMQLSNQQMDEITAGHLEVDVSNTSVSVVSLWQRGYLTESTPNNISCSSCFLVINTSTLSVASQFGPPGPPIGLPQ